MKKVKPIFVGIAGGSGSGKSTLANALKEKFSSKIELVHLDDYIKPIQERPITNGLINTDHPDSIDFENLRNNLKNVTNKESAQIILIEGFLLLHDEEIRKMLDISIYLDLCEEKRWARRLYKKDEARRNKILIPMHNKYIEPTKSFADHVIDVNNLSEKNVVEIAEHIINNIHKINLI